jgi:hypothetical protein
VKCYIDKNDLGSVFLDLCPKTGNVLGPKGWKNVYEGNKEKNIDGLGDVLRRWYHHPGDDCVSLCATP